MHRLQSSSPPVKTPEELGSFWCHSGFLTLVPVMFSQVGLLPSLPTEAMMGGEWSRVVVVGSDMAVGGDRNGGTQEGITQFSFVSWPPGLRNWSLFSSPP